MTEPLRLERPRPGVARVVLDRPELRNAFDDGLVARLTATFEALAADAAVRLARGEQVDAPTEVRGVPTMLLAPFAVTRKEIEPVILRKGVFTLGEICVEPFTQACTAAGLTEEEQ